MGIGEELQGTEESIGLRGDEHHTANTKIEQAHIDLGGGIVIGSVEGDEFNGVGLSEYEALARVMGVVSGIDFEPA